MICHSKSAIDPAPQDVIKVGQLSYRFCMTDLQEHEGCNLMSMAAEHIYSYCFEYSFEYSSDWWLNIAGGPLLQFSCAPYRWFAKYGSLLCHA
jgi:hypothetical protein